MEWDCVRLFTMFCSPPIIFLFSSFSFSCNITTTGMFFGGLFIVFDKIPRGWYWFSWTSFLRYAWGSMMLNQFAGEENGSLPIFYGDNGKAQNILEFYGLEGNVMGSIGACLGLLSGLIGIFSLVGVVGLMFIRHDKR